MMLAWLALAWASEVVDDEELPDEETDRPIEVVREQEAEAPPNRGRVVLHGGVGQWLLPAPVAHAGLQLHLSRMFALNVEVAGAGVTVLHPDDGDRYRALLPTSVVGLVIDPVTTGVRPQVGVDLTATVWQLSSGGAAVAPGMRARVGLDATVAGPLCWSIEGYAGSAFAEGLASRVNPRWPEFAASTGIRTGLGVRW